MYRRQARSGVAADNPTQGVRLWSAGGWTEDAPWSSEEACFTSICGPCSGLTLPGGYAKTHFNGRGRLCSLHGSLWTANQEKHKTEGQGEAEDPDNGDSDMTGHPIGPYAYKMKLTDGEEHAARGPYHWHSLPLIDPAVLQFLFNRCAIPSTTLCHWKRSLPRSSSSLALWLISLPSPPLVLARRRW